MLTRSGSIQSPSSAKEQLLPLDKLRSSLCGLAEQWPCQEGGLGWGDWQREKGEQGMISAFPGQSLGRTATW